MSAQSPIDIDSIIPPEDEEAYLRWRRARIQAAIDDPRPSIPHSHVMARIKKRLQSLEEKEESKAEK